MPSSDSSRDVVLERLAAEFVERHRNGERPPLSEYTDRYAELSADIRDLFPALVQIEKLKPPADATGAFDLVAASSKGPGLERLGDYRVLREVGRGGMGIVYEAEQESLGRHVALKVLPASALLNPTYLERFRREAKAAARLHHTNIVPVFGVGEADGVHFYAMQFIRGEGLDKVLADVRRLRRKSGEALAAVPSEWSVAHSLLRGQFGPTPDASQTEPVEPSRTSTTSGLSATSPEADYCRGIARIGVQVADALTYAHRQGILHRDIKPSNLLLDLQGTVWITDFGLAKTEGTDELTHTGDIVGTIRFMAPERFEGTSLPQSDVYALGVTLYEMLTLRPAFDDTNKAKLIDKALHEPPTPPRKSDPRVPRDLETIVLKCLAKDPRERYASAEALAEDLRRFLGDRPIRARRATATEQAWRWCRRNPAVAGLTVAVSTLVLAVAVISTAAAMRLKSELNVSDAAKLEQRRELYRGYVTEAKYRRYSRRQGQRFATLEAITKARKLLSELNYTDSEQRQEQELLRDLAISCLTLPDVRVVREWDGWPEGSSTLVLDDRSELYARSDQQGNVSVRRLTDDQEVFHLDGDGKPAWLYFTPGDRLLVVWRSSNKVEGWRVGDASPSFTLTEAGPPAVFRVTGDGRTLAAGLPDGTVTLYSLPDGTVRRRERVAASDKLGLEFSPDGNYLAAVGGNYRQPERCVLHVFDLRSQKPPTRLTHPEWVYSVAWYPDSRTLATGDWETANDIHVWDVPSGRKLEMNPRQKGGAAHVSVNRTGDVLASTSVWGGGFRLWHAHTGEELLTIPASEDVFNGVLQDGRLTALNREGTKLRLMELVPGQVHRAIVRDVRAEKGKRYFSPTLHPNGRLLAVSMESGVGLWDLPSGRELAFLPLGRTETAIFDSSGTLWTYGHEGMQRWPVHRASEAGTVDVGPPQTVLDVPTYGVGMAVNNDGRVAVASLGPARYAALVFHRDRPHQPVRLGPHEDVRDVSVSPDGRFVVTASRESRGLKVWDAHTGNQLQHLFPNDKLWRATFTSDGRWLIAGGKRFRVGTWEEVAFERQAVPAGVISGDGRWLACTGNQEGTPLFDLASGQRLAALAIPGQGKVWNLTLSHDGTLLAGTDLDNLMIHVWDLRKLRAELRARDLDWDAPPYPTAAAPEQGLLAVPQVRVNLGELEDDAILGPTPTPEHLFALVGANSLVLAAQPLNFKAYRQRGRAWGQLGQARAAIADYGAALALWPHADPARADLFSRRAGNYFALGEYDNALTDVRRAEQSDPARAAGIRSRHATLLNGRAWRLVAAPPDQRDLGRALDAIRVAVELAPDDPNILNTLGVVQYRSGQYQAAVVTLEKSLAAGGGTSDGFDLFFLGMCHAGLGDAARAKGCFDAAVKWVDAQKDLPEKHAQELKAFRAEAEAALANLRPRE
jgi:eukaryotic-like serine/threonine-protein kinase